MIYWGLALELTFIICIIIEGLFSMKRGGCHLRAHCLPPYITYLRLGTKVYIPNDQISSHA